MIKVLFLIHDLGQGGAEKVLVNLVNNMDRSRFQVSVMALFGGGVNEQFLAKDIRLIICHKKPFPGNSHIMKLFTPERLYCHYIKEKYDIIVSYLEGPSARIVSGCTDPATKKIAWIHIEQRTKKNAAGSFRSYEEAMQAYNNFDRIVCVSKTVQEDFLRLLPVSVSTQVLYNTNESEKILTLSQESVESDLFSDEELKLIAVGRLLKHKGFHRLVPMIKQLRDEGLPAHLYILGVGPMKEEIETLAANCGVSNAVTLLGYHTNPYKYVAKCDLFVCASYAEGFSTAATEALIVGTPVCTVEVSGMKEMLGDHNEWGIVTQNDETALYEGIKRLLDNAALLSHYTEKALERGRMFNTVNTVMAVEKMLTELEDETFCA